jgi:hypothetical protein
MAELVVDLPFVGIPQDLIGLCGFLEFFFGFLVSGIFVRVVS